MAEQKRYRSIIDVHVILERGGEILLLERRGTGYCDGMLHLPSGHLDDGEPVTHGAAREAFEEVGVRIAPDALRLAAVVHHRQHPDLARIGFFFAASRWKRRALQRRTAQVRKAAVDGPCHPAVRHDRLHGRRHPRLPDRRPAHPPRLGWHLSMTRPPALLHAGGGAPVRPLHRRYAAMINCCDCRHRQSTTSGAGRFHIYGSSNAADAR